MEAIRGKLMVTKAGSGSTSYRTSLRTSWLKEMGLDADNRSIRLIFDGQRIIIESAAKALDTDIVYKTMYALADAFTEVTDEQINEIVENTLDKFEEDYMSFENFDENTLKAKLVEYLKEK